MANSSVNQTKLSDTFPVWKSIRPFALGGMAGCFATCCIQPIDMVKVRIQLSGEAGAAGSAARGPFAIASSIIKNEGFLSLYKGLSAALLRQLTYGTTRLGLFRTLSNTFGDKDGKTSFGTKISISLVSGGVGALVGTPADAVIFN